MGQIIPPRTWGDDCPNWDPPRETPLEVFAVFWDVLKGDAGTAVQPPVLHIFRLDQVEFQPCLFRYDNAAYGWFVEFGLDALKSWLWLADRDVPKHYYFADSTGPSPIFEYHIFENIYQAAPGNYGYEGWGTVFWMDAMRKLLIDLAISSADDIMLEMSGIEDNYLVVKLCSHQLFMNMKVKLTP